MASWHDADGCGAGYVPLVVGSAVCALVALVGSSTCSSTTSTRLRLLYSFVVAAASFASAHRLRLPPELSRAHVCVADSLLLRPPPAAASPHLLIGVWTFGPVLVAIVSTIIYNVGLSSSAIVIRCSRSKPWSEFEADATKSIQRRRRLEEALTSALLWLSFFGYLPLCDALARALEATVDDEYV